MVVSLWFVKSLKTLQTQGLVKSLSSCTQTRVYAPSIKEGHIALYMLMDRYVGIPKLTTYTWRMLIPIDFDIVAQGGGGGGALQTLLVLLFTFH